MIELFGLVLVGGLVTWGAYASFQPGMIFEKFGDFIETLPTYLSKPLGTCPVCMASFYGFFIYWGEIFVYNSYLDEWTSFPGGSFFQYILFTFALAGLNYLVLWYSPDAHEDT